MKLQSQVCTLEQAKRLKELGIIQQSYFAHFCPCETGLKWLSNSESFVGVKAERKTYYHTTKKDEESLIEQHIYSAFNVAELGVMIGRGTRMAEAHWQWLMDCVNSGCSSTVAYNAVALAGFIITQLENNLTTPEEVNTRLIQS
jgi:hypothetical protein